MKEVTRNVRLRTTTLKLSVIWEESDAPPLFMIEMRLTEAQ